MPPLAVILAWPVVSAILFSRITAPMAVLATIFVGFLMLPHGRSLDLPLLAPLDKLTIPAVSALLFCFALTDPKQLKTSLPGLWPRSAIMQILLLILPVSAFMMVLTNSDPLFYGPLVLPGLRIYDALAVLQNLIIFLIPMILARKFLGDLENQKRSLQFLVYAGLGYSLLAIVEVIMSPQINLWIYGYFPHSFIQHYRYGGWRPIVFMQHGLVLSLVFALCTIAAVSLFKYEKENRSRMLFAACWLFMTLWLSKSLGAFMIAVLMIGLILFLTARLQVIIAAVICAIFLLYPVLRANELIPVDRILETIASINPERASSLEVRFFHEDQMLQKANERPIFGWGVWGRSRVYDPVTGYDKTIADGYWAINIGVGGWVKYLSEMGLLTIPVFLLLLRRHRHRIDRVSAAFALMIAANVVDLIPNSGLTPLTMLLAGSLWGRLEAKAPALADSADTTEPDVGSDGPGYTRQRKRFSREPVPDAPSATKRANAYKRPAKDHVRMSLATHDDIKTPR